MNRSELAHILRAAGKIAEDPDILVIGSQSILGSYDERELPDEATRSIEADIAFFDDRDDEKADAVDGAIGEQSPFHQTFGIYGQGVGLSTATLPDGWRARLVPFDDARAEPSHGLCLEPHDLVVSKLVAGRGKDFEFARALLAEDLVDAEMLCERAGLLPVVPATRRRIVDWIRGVVERLPTAAPAAVSAEEDEGEPG